jgi:recombination associated protein RdgC
MTSPATELSAAEAIAPVSSSETLTLSGRCFFKNAVVFRLPADFNLSSLDLENALATRPLTDISPLESERSGWVNSSPLGRSVHTVNNQHLIALGVHKKILPASMIKQEVVKRAAVLAAEQGAPLGRKQLRKLKDEVKVELLAKAMVRTTATRAWLDTNRGWLVVEAAGAARAEKLVETLRVTLGGSLAATLLDPEQAPTATMASWLRAGEAPTPFSLDTDLELQSEAGATVKYARHALDGADIQQHLNAGKIVVRLGLTWNDRVSFVLTSKLEIKKISFLSLLTEEESPESEKAESADSEFDADLTLMSDDLGQLLVQLDKALGPSAPAPAPAVQG